MDNYAVIFCIISFFVHFINKFILPPIKNAGINFNFRTNFICNRFHRLIIVYKPRLIRFVVTSNLRPRRWNRAIDPVAKGNLPRFIIKCTHICRALSFQRIYDLPLCPFNKHFRCVFHNWEIINIPLLICLPITQGSRSSPIAFFRHPVVRLIVTRLPRYRHTVAFNIQIRHSPVMFAKSSHPVILPGIAKFISKLKTDHPIGFFMPIFRARCRPINASVWIAAIIWRIQILHQICRILWVAASKTINKNRFRIQIIVNPLHRLIYAKCRINGRFPSSRIKIIPCNRRCSLFFRPNRIFPCKQI